MSRTWSPELNFVPSRAPYEITDKVAGQKLVDCINGDLAYVGKSHGFRQLDMVAKLDPFHPTEDDTDWASWSVEIVPVTHFDTNWLEIGEDWDTFRKFINSMFFHLKKEYGLVPSVTKRRNGNEIRYPTGGSHVQMGADVFEMGSHFYQNMERFHRNLTMEYANIPWLRWLFADWNSNKATHTLYNPHNENWVSILTTTGEARDKQIEDILFSKMLVGDVHAIEPRFMIGGKNSYLTFEFRFFRMVENADELRLIVQFCDAWMTSLKTRTLHGKPVEFTLTKTKWDQFTKKSPEILWKKHIEPFFEHSLGLCSENYRLFFERNYLTRRRYGSMV